MLPDARRELCKKFFKIYFCTLYVCFIMSLMKLCVTRCNNNHHGVQVVRIQLRRLQCEQSCRNVEWSRDDWLKTFNQKLIFAHIWLLPRWFPWMSRVGWGVGMREEWGRPGDWTGLQRARSADSWGSWGRRAAECGCRRPTSSWLTSRRECIWRALKILCYFFLNLIY